jgi:hypothetical protein
MEETEVTELQCNRFSKKRHENELTFWLNRSYHFRLTGQYQPLVRTQSGHSTGEFRKARSCARNLLRAL